MPEIYLLVPAVSSTREAPLISTVGVVERLSYTTNT